MAIVALFWISFHLKNLAGKYSLSRIVTCLLPKHLSEKSFLHFSLKMSLQVLPLCILPDKASLVSTGHEEMCAGVKFKIKNYVEKCK
jgi:hypothetical protein